MPYMKEFALPTEPYVTGTAVEYFKLFHGQNASFNQIISESPYMEHAVDKLIDTGAIVGQRTLDIEPDGSDVILWSAKEDSRG